MRTPLLAAVLTLGLLLAGLFLWIDRSGPELGLLPTLDTTYLLDQPVPDFRFTDLDGRELSLSEYAAGRPTVLVARDALCPVSRRYGPTTARLSQQYSHKGVQFLFINVSPLDTPETMREDYSRYDLRGTYTHDPNWLIAGLLRMISTAEVFLLDERQILRYRGAIDDQYGIRFTKPEPRNSYLRSGLDELLLAQSVTTKSTSPEGCYLATEVWQNDHNTPTNPID